MNRTNFVAVLDPSTLIWDKDDYQSNTHEYINVLSTYSQLISNLDKYPILLSDGLLKLIQSEFPYSETQGDLWALAYRVIDFFSKTGSRAIPYDKQHIESIESTPNQVKNHFVKDLKDEVNYLISYCHDNVDENRAYFSFKYFWNDTDILNTKTEKTEVDHTAVIVDRNNSLETFFGQFQLEFEHKYKHDLSQYKDKEAWKLSNPEEKKKFVSQLSCLNDDKGQELLDKRFDILFGNERYYSYDSTNDVYIVFRITNNNIFHAHDEYNIDNVPLEVKRHFRVFKYSWL